MYMPYTTNPHIAKVRRDAVNLVKYRHWSMRKVARNIGVGPSTISRWCADPFGTGWHEIPTRSSRPRSHPNTLSEEIVRRIIEMRLERNQCAEVLHHRLRAEGLTISLSSVKRTLKRLGFSRFSKWKKWHRYPEKPLPKWPGILVQIDSMHDGPATDRLSLYALIDVCSRWGFAEPSLWINSRQSLLFLAKAKRVAPFELKAVQSDHGSEYSKWFSKMTEARGINHCHSRVRTPTDNAYVERFIQTLQMQCLNRTTRTFDSWKREIPKFLEYYNNERPHMALKMQTPSQVLRRY
jgi:transposase InsO family protein